MTYVDERLSRLQLLQQGRGYWRPGSLGLGPHEEEEVDDRRCSALSLATPRDQQGSPPAARAPRISTIVATLPRPAPRSSLRRPRPQIMPQGAPRGVPVPLFGPGSPVPSLGPSLPPGGRPCYVTLQPTEGMLPLAAGHPQVISPEGALGAGPFAAPWWDWDGQLGGGHGPGANDVRPGPHTFSTFSPYDAVQAAALGPVLSNRRM